jgi:hypothetical protein
MKTDASASKGWNPKVTRKLGNILYYTRGDRFRRLVQLSGAYNATTGGQCVKGLIILIKLIMNNRE